MGYRRPDGTTPGTSRWRLKHRAFLISCGIPDAIVGSNRSLTYALLHGDDELGTGWRAADLTPEQAARLLPFLEQEGLSDGYDIVLVLRKRLSPPGDAG